MTDQALAALIERTRFLLLDFDGPVCAVFASYPASTVAEQLRGMLVGQDVTLPEHIRAEADPLAVLRFTVTLNRPELVRDADDVLTAAEITAARTATPTPHAREVIVAAHRNRRRVAIVSNNSAEAIAAYLAAHRLTRYVHPVIGRARADPARMKPHPAPVLTAVAELAADPTACVLVGDSPTDIEAAHAAGVPAIGYANKPGKRNSLARAEMIIPSMADLATVLSPDQLP